MTFHFLPRSGWRIDGPAASVAASVVACFAAGMVALGGLAHAQESGGPAVPRQPVVAASSPASGAASSAASGAASAAASRTVPGALADANAPAASSALTEAARHVETSSKPTHALGASPARLGLAHALLKAMDTAARQTSMQDELLQMARLGFEQSVQQMPKPPAEPQLVWKGLMPKLKARIDADFPSKAWLDAYAKVYAERFDEAELQGMLQFFSSPAGQAYVQRMPLVFSDTLAAQQRLFLPLMDKLQRLTLQALRQSARPAVKDMPAQGDMPPP